jgi:hypothetical protein
MAWRLGGDYNTRKWMHRFYLGDNSAFGCRSFRLLVDVIVALTDERIPRFISQTLTTSPYEVDIIGQDFFESRINPTPPERSDRLQPPHNPSVVVSIPTGPTRIEFCNDVPYACLSTRYVGDRITSNADARPAWSSRPCYLRAIQSPK